MSAAANDWPSVKLGDIGQSLIGLTYDPSSVRSNGTLVLRSSNIQDGALAFDDNVFVDCAIPDRIRIRSNDILICVRNGSRRLIGKSVLLDSRVVGETFGAFMAIYRSDANAFLKYFFQSYDFKRQINEHLGATINQITNGSLNSFIVSLPDSTERDEIRKRLDDVDALVLALDRMIVKKNAMKQGILQSLFSQATRLPSFKEPWRKAIVGELIEQHRTVVDPRRFPTSSFQHFSLPAFDDGEQPIEEEGSFIESIKFAVPEGAVLVSKLNPRIPRIWAPRDIQSNAIASTEFIVMTPRPGVGRSYLKWMMKSSVVAARMKLLAIGTTGSHARINQAQVMAITVEIPQLDEQIAIAEVLDDVDDDIRALHHRLVKARAIKEGMIQELLSGRIRLVTGETAA